MQISIMFNNLVGTNFNSVKGHNIINFAKHYVNKTSSNY